MSESQPFGATALQSPDEPKRRTRLKDRSNQDTAPSCFFKVDGPCDRRRFETAWNIPAVCLALMLSTSLLTARADTNSSRAMPSTSSPSAAIAFDSVTQADVVYKNYRFRDGQSLPQLRLHYATMGAPDRDDRGRIDNAILVIHWTGASGAILSGPGFQKALFGSAGPMDASRYFLIFPDNIGHGRSSKPSDGLRMRFPNYTYGDMVDLQHRLVTETLGINHLHAILGLSMGGMNAWQWAEMYPDAIDGIMPVVSLPVSISGRNALWRRLLIQMIKADPAWKGGDYTAQPHGLISGLPMLRMMINGVPRLQQSITDAAAADRFIRDVEGQAMHEDANDLIYALQSSMVDYNPEPALSSIRTKVYALNFSDDEFNPDVLQILERSMPEVPKGQYFVQPGTPESFGHLSMAHLELWASHVTAFMHGLDN